MDTLHHSFLLLMFMHYALGSNSTCVKILPDSISKIPVEVGKNFTATCHLLEGSGYTSDDTEWLLENISIAKQYYHKINETSISVTVNVSNNMNGWLICKASRKSLSFKNPCVYGILLDAGYPPLKPENLTCIAVQEGKDISSDLKCSWEFESRDPVLDTTYTLYATICLTNSNYHATCNQRLAKTCTINLSTFPFAMDVRVWVEVKNALGSVRSDELLCNDALNFVKPNPPLDVRVLAEVNSTSLMVTWKHPIDIFKLSYVIRYCQVDSDVWTKVPESFTQAHTESFRLQSLEPYTEYVVQMRCIREHHQSYWSDWSANATVRTAEAISLPPDQVSQGVKKSKSSLCASVSVLQTSICIQTASIRHSPKPVARLLPDSTDRRTFTEHSSSSSHSASKKTQPISSHDPEAAESL